MRKIVLIVALSLGGGCNLYLDLAPLGGSPDMPLDMATESDVELDLVVNDMPPDQDADVPDLPDMQDMADMVDLVDMPGETDADMGENPAEMLLAEALIAYDFKSFSMGFFPNVGQGGDPLRASTGVNWTNNNAIAVTAAALDAPAPEKFYTEAISNQAFTLAIWLRPARLDLVNSETPEDPDFNGRIFTLSANSALRNFTVAQWRQQLHVRMRDVNTTTNGLPPHVEPEYFELKVQYLVVTVANGRLTIYRDGRAVAAHPVGEFEWHIEYGLRVANEFNQARPWEGEIYDIRLWSRGLEDGEVGLLYGVGVP